jgi:hypothetical protein
MKTGVGQGREYSVDEAAFQAVLDDWLSIGQEVNPVPDWELRIAVMVQEMRDLQASGHWRTGGRTLLHALGLHHDEVRLCRALAWLMTPDGWHGLGDRFLRSLLARIDIVVADTATASVVTEEINGSTRADIVLRVGSQTVLIEAKVSAGEQPAQADRLAAGWADESPRLIFLTPDGRTPTTAHDSREQWTGLAWREVAKTLEDIVDDHVDCAPGVRDFLETLQRYGG